MKYYLDTEFIEGFPPVRIFGVQLPKWLAKRRHTIQLISIGLVSEDGREYYAISKDFDLKFAWNNKWLRENVLLPIYNEWGALDPFSFKTMKECINDVGMSNKHISQDVLTFINGGCLSDLRCGLWPDMAEVEKHNPNKYGNAQPEIYAYYADYDWVLFCSSLFGTMMDLPDGFPMYCRDLKQMVDEKAEKIYNKTMYSKANTLDTLGQKLIWLKDIKGYPKQEKEHDALDDANWNKNLYDWLSTL